MPVKVTKEEKLIEVAIMKAKQVLQEFNHGTTVRLDEDVMGEDIKLKRPKKNPSEEKIKTEFEGGRHQRRLDKINEINANLKFK